MNDQKPALVDITRLPRLRVDTDNADDLALAQAYRDLRLLALRTNPEAFGSTYEIESQRGIDQTLQRLGNPKATTFIAIRGDSDDLPSATWLGSITLVGPQDDDAPAFSAKTNPLASTTTFQRSNVLETRLPLRFVIHGIFVRRDSRGSGLGKRLMKAALDEAQDSCRSLVRQDFVCSIAVDVENAAARALYERVGFALVGQETYTQQPREVAPGVLRPSERLADCLELRVDVR